MTIVSGLTKALPKLIPAVVSAINTITVELTSHTDEFILAALDLIVALAEGLVKALPTIVSTIVFQVIPKLLEAFGRLGEQLPGKALQWGKDLISSLINGIKSMLGSLGNAVQGVAQKIASFLHFSCPEVGPLAKFNESGGDMIDEFIKSMEGEQPELTKALYQTAEIINGGMSTAPNYSGALAGISSQLAGLGGNNGNYVINVQVGKTTLATAVISAQQMENYRTGGT
jgi:phage-related protein